MDPKYSNDYFAHQNSLLLLDQGKMNVAYSALDRNLEIGNGNKTAYVFEDADGTCTQYSFFTMVKKSNQIANYLVSKAWIVKGDRVFLFLPRIPELYISFFGILKTGAIASILFSAFQAEALKDRLEDSGATAIFTTTALLPRLLHVKKNLPQLKHIFVIDEEKFQNELDLQPDHFKVFSMNPDDPAFMLYTSGTTGKPKGIVHAHGGIVQQIESAKVCLDLQSDDIYWCTADPGWITGIVYSLIANMALGVTTTIYTGSFNPASWYEFIQKHKITVWYTAPTAIRLLMAKEEELAKQFDLSSLRYLASVGEPLNPEAIMWGKNVFGLFFHDGWWQTETGSIMIANHPELGIHPGSMGKPMPWVEAAILDDDMQPVAAHVEGNLCLKPYWPSLMRTVWNNDAKYHEYFKSGWYISGDRAKKDEKGYFWFVGRADDVIKTSGERVGPFEVESSLIAFPGVVEAGVIGKPDEIRGEIIKAYVVLKPDVIPTEALKHQLQDHVRLHLAAHAYPREIEFIDRLPKTRSGKIMRRLLRAKELNLPVGDTSTLENF